MRCKPTCKEIHRLTSERLDRKLTLIERARMHVHFLACRGCRNFDGQMFLIRRAMRTLSAPDEFDKDHQSK